MFGDYEAQRHWMEITTALPILDWYEQTEENDLQYWGLDYPPLTAFHSWLLGKLGHLADPACFALHSSRGHEGVGCKVFLRLSVIVSDLLVYLPGERLSAMQDPALLTSTVLLLWLLPPLVLIDHGHFQYNGVCLGLCLAAAGCVARGRTALGSVLFTSGLLFKQIALYYAPAFFFGILGICLWQPPAGIFNVSRRVVATGVVVLCTAALLLMPWLLSGQPVAAVLQILHRMFPFARGLYEDKVANFWCSVSVVFKVHRVLPAAYIPRLCAAVTLAALLPSALCSLRPGAGRGAFAATLFTSSLSFFLFAFQVHEKGILFPAAAAALLPMALPSRHVAMAVLAARHFQLVALFSMYPLMVKDALVLPYALACLALVAVCEADLPPCGGAVRALLRTSYLLGLLLHGIHAFAPVPARYPDLWTLLITSASCGYFLCSLIVVSVAQMRGLFSATEAEDTAKQKEQ
ncbi:gny [Symbiodinium natans]|uniref:Alpha-1,3-glucosyltransferase n=1 Tax=Symbiodinium natans TaxID=878477 RepID=A0A812JDU3_9DINO|nr:gny [Symbiodinium natans]